MKGFHTALRYEATDEREPKWLALYDVDSPEVLSSDAYKSLAPKASERERKLLPRLGKLNRRVYSLIGTHGDTGISKLPSKHVVFAAIGVKSEDEEEYEKWCVEEHIDLISKIPGWIHSRRYKLDSAVELIANADKNDPPSGTYLNIHFSDRPWDTALPEVKTATGTPRALEMLKKTTSRDLRQFVLYKDVGKPTWK